MAKINPAQVERFLKDMDYPVSKADLVKHAQQHGADENVMAVLQKLPNKNFEGASAVNKAISEIERSMPR